MRATASTAKNASLPSWLQKLCNQHELVVIVSGLTEREPIAEAAKTQGLDVHFHTMSMGDAEMRKAFNDLKAQLQAEQLPMVFYRGEYLGGLAGLQRQLRKQVSRSLARYATLLGLAGLLPFLFAALAVHMKWHIWGFDGNDLLVAYGVVIAAFMAGTCWGGSFGPATVRQLLISNLAALAVVPAVRLPHEAALPLLFIVLAALCCFDWARFRAAELPRWYISLRFLVSAVAMSCLAYSWLFA